MPDLAVAQQAAGFTVAQPAPLWSLLVAETRTGRVTGRLPLAGLSWSCPLRFGGPAVFRALVALDGPPGGGSETVTDRVRAIAAGPWRFMLVAIYGATPIAYGMVGAPRPTAGAVELACSDLHGLLSRRLVAATGQRTNLRSTDADLVYGPTTLPQIARLLLQQATADTAQELPLSISSPPSTGGSFRGYLASDLASYGQRLAQLTQDDGGPDITVTPELSSDQANVTLRVDIGAPYLTQVGDPWMWSYPGQIVDVEVDVDPSTMGSTVYVPGDGIDKDRPIGVATDPGLTDAGFPQLDVVDARFGSSKTQTEVDGYARAGLAVYTRALESWRLRVRADAHPVLGTWRRGDTVLLHIEGHYWIPNGSYLRRIVDVSGDHTTTVTVDTAPVPAEV